MSRSLENRQGAHTGRLRRRTARLKLVVRTAFGRPIASAALRTYGCARKMPDFTHFLPFTSVEMTSHNQRVARALELAKEVFMIGAGSTVSLEHHKYERIPGTNRSVRFDRGDPGKRTEDHAHIFAQRGGQGAELFSVNCNGRGHDGSRGAVVPKKVADFLQQRGYRIPANLTLESIDLEVVEPGGWGIVVVLEAEPPLDTNRPAWLNW